MSDLIIVLWGAGALIALYFAIMLLSIPFKVWKMCDALEDIKAAVNTLVIYAEKLDKKKE